MKRGNILIPSRLRARVKLKPAGITSPSGNARATAAGKSWSIWVCPTTEDGQPSALPPVATFGRGESLLSESTCHYDSRRFAILRFAHDNLQVAAVVAVQTASRPAPSRC